MVSIAHLDRVAGSFKRRRAGKSHTAAIFLGWATFSFKARVLWNGCFDVFRWREVIVEGLCLWGWAAAGRKMYDFDHPDAAGLREGKRHARAEGKGGFGDMRAVNAEFAGLDKLGGKRPGLEEPRVPEPLVDPLCFGQLPLSFRPISAAAKGLSGSILSFFGGRDEKLRGLLS